MNRSSNIRKNFWLGIGVTLLIGALISCTSLLKPSTDIIKPTDPFDRTPGERIFAAQNWTEQERAWFYTTSQGSNLLPYEIFLHLERHDTSELFRSDNNMNRLRYLTEPVSPDNPDALPVGWVKNTYEEIDYLGLTCSACHTGELQVGTTAIRIDGGPALADMDSMMRELQLAIEAPLASPEKFSRLLSNIYGQDSAQQRASLTQQLTKVAGELQEYNRINAPIHNGQRVEYGYARLDAFGRIFNRILSHLTPSQPNNFNPANAPVSYPFLWDTPQHDFVQWNGVGDNADNGSLGRNTGEVLGVFASMDLSVTAGAGYPSSALIRELSAMEDVIEKLWSPSWEELAKRKALPSIDASLAEQGRQVFERYQCQQCHAPINRTDPNREVIAQFTSLPRIGTDPFMARNALSYTGKSGYFEGKPKSLLTPSGDKFGETTPVLTALSHATEGVIINAKQRNDAPKETFVRSGFAGTGGKTASRETSRHLDFDIVDKKNPYTLLAYKGRPLNGIWATAPYLHNGSVPTLYDLFSRSCSDTEIAAREACRPNKFTLGSREFDPQKVGFTERDPSKYPDVFVFDTSLPSNSNKGHEFTSGITPMIALDENNKPIRNADGSVQQRYFPAINEADKLALVEYLKTL